MGFTFIHAADLHLDAPFRGITEVLEQKGNAKLGRLLRSATFTALDRLVSLCLAEEADFLVLAGDVYNASDSSLRARMALKDAFARLDAAGIGVYLAHGNHDPYREIASIPWPDNVRVFGLEMTVFEARLKKGGTALVHGVSHATDREKRNLAKLFRRRDAHCFQLGVLHCALTGASEGHALYAPCTLADLAETGLDYFALGHVHSPNIFGLHGTERKPPYAAYSGSLQGLHGNEPGPRGCLLARVDDAGRAEPEFRPLAPVVWENVQTAAPEDVPSLEALVLERLEEAACRAGAEALVAGLELTGNTALDSELRKEGHLETLLARLREQLPENIWLRRIRLNTRPLRDPLEYLERPDLTGEVARAARAMLHDPEGLDEARQSLRQLYSPKVRRILGEPGDEAMKELLAEAELLCLNLLEEE